MIIEEIFDKGTCRIQDKEFCEVCGFCRTTVRENLVQLRDEEKIVIVSEIKKGRSQAGMVREIFLTEKFLEQLAASSRVS